MKKETSELREEISSIHKEMQQLFKKVEKVRSYYKYQCEETDSSSESFIINFNNLIGDTYGVICDLDELIEWEEGADEE